MSHAPVLKRGADWLVNILHDERFLLSSKAWRMGRIADHGAVDMLRLRLVPQIQLSRGSG